MSVESKEGSGEIDRFDFSVPVVETAPSDALKDQVLSNADKLLGLKEHFGLTEVVIAYDGYGDSGEVSAISGFDQDRKVDLSHPCPNAQLAQNADDWLLDYGYDLLASRFGGWEIDAGSYGEITIDFVERELRFDHSWRVDSSEEDFRTEQF